MLKTVAMSRKKETKGTVVFEAKDNDVCRSIYLLKGTFSGRVPEVITLQVEWEDSAS